MPTPNPANPPPSAGLRLGRAEGQPVELSPETLRGGLLLLSSDGHARRRLSVGMVRALARRWPLWVVTDKPHYRSLADELLVIRRARLKLNVLRTPPGVEPRSWRAVLWEAFSGIFALGSEVAARGAEHLEEVVADVGPEDATFVEVAKRAVALLPDQSLHPLVTTLAEVMHQLASVLDDPVGLDVSGLRGRGVIFEVGGLPLRHQAFLTAALVEGEVRGEPREGLERLIWFDEGGLLWWRRWPEPLRRRWRAALGALGRAGAGVALVTEASSTLEPSVLEVLGTRMALSRQIPYEEDGVRSLLGVEARRFALLGDDQVMLAPVGASAPPAAVTLDPTLLPDLAPPLDDDTLDALSDGALQALGL